MNTIAFFNNKGGVGKTTLVYHLAWMLAERGLKVVVADLDPQANATAMFLGDERMWEMFNANQNLTVYDAIQPLIDRTGDLAHTHVEQVNENLGVILGSLLLSQFEDLLSREWNGCLNGDVGAFRVETSFYRMILKGAREFNADIVLIDVGPNLGAINRAALIGADHVVVPLAPDLYSIQGLQNLGPSLRRWREDWRKRLNEANGVVNIELPEGLMEPMGYVVMQHSVRVARPVQAYQKWVERIPNVYRTCMLNEKDDYTGKVEDDPHLLALLKHYRSLMPMAQTARKPMFLLRQADGVFGAQLEAVTSCYQDFLQLAKRVAEGVNIDLE